VTNHELARLLLAQPLLDIAVVAVPWLGQNMGAEIDRVEHCMAQNNKTTLSVLCLRFSWVPVTSIEEDLPPTTTIN
jgi:hypothetical protein